MSRVVPSQIVELIDQAIPEAQKQAEKNTGGFCLTQNDHAAICTAIVELFDQIPPEMLLLSSSRYNELIFGISAIRAATDRWKNQAHAFDPSGGYKWHPVTLVRQALSNCPDESPSDDVPQLTFINDADFESSLRIDISSANKALSNGEWKAATVLSGSIMEALLLWSLRQKRREEVFLAADNLKRTGVITNKVPRELNKWELSPLIEVAADLNIIEGGTLVLARLSKNFRNLIHPGRESRLKQKCDRGTALSTLAAVEHVIRDIVSPPT